MADMLGSSPELGWTLLVVVVTTTAIVIGFRIYPQLRPKAKHLSLPEPKRRHITLRIDDIPAETEPAAFQERVRLALEDDAALRDIETEHHFLIPRNDKWSCATTSFYTSISPKDLVSKLKQAGPGRPYQFDYNFHGFTPLYEDPEGAHADLIAVPGLGSHAVGTWKAPGCNTVWLRDFLPDAVPGIRVLLYGYDTSLLSSGSKDSIEDLGRRFLEALKAFRGNTDKPRPIIFIGHSLGGLLIKEALVHAWKHRDDPQSTAIRETCYALLLFGVPNLGLRQEQLHSIVQGKPNEALIKSLVVDNDSEPSSFLKRLSADFAECCREKYKVISFFERKKSPTVEIRPDGSLATTGTETLLVTEKSATSTGLTATADETNIPLSTDHSGLVKYRKRNQEDYSIVETRLLTLVAEAVGARFDAAFSPFTVPFPQDPKFVGRDKVLEAIDSRLGKTDSRVALIGLGGVGKSQIAIEYAYRTQEKEPQRSIFWVYASNVSRFTQAYREIADELEIPGRNETNVDILDLVNRWLCNERNGCWLMILDNADDNRTFYSPTADPSSKALRDFIPRSEKGSILITSRDKIAARNLVDDDRDRIIELQGMTELEALGLLEAKAPKELLLGSDEREHRELIVALGCIPLAISHASAFIDTQGVSISEYLRFFHETEERRVSLLSNEEIEKSRRDASATPAVLATWQISFDQIRDTKPEAAHLLALMSMFDAQGIPKGLVTGHMDKLVSIGALAALANFSLIKKQQEQNFFEMHALVQLATRDWLQRSGQLGKCRRLALRIMAGSFPSGEYETWPECAVLLPHAKALLDYTPMEGDHGEFLLWGTVADRAAWYLYNLGEFAASRDISQVARDGKEKVLGKEHPETLWSSSILASAQMRLGMNDEAVSTLEDVLEKLEKTQKIPGEETPQMLWSTQILAIALFEQGKYTEAESMFRRALKGRLKVFGEEHWATLGSMHGMGNALLGQGKAKEAEEMCRRALQGREKKLGKDHPDTLSTANSLALALEGQGKHKEAGVLKGQVLGRSKVLLGEEHPTTLIFLDHLGCSQRIQGKFGEAEATHRQALEGRRKTLGAKHPHTLESLHNLAIALHAQGRYDEAETFYRQAIEGREEAFGKEHPGVFFAVHNLAVVLEHQGRYVEAEANYRRARDGLVGVFGEGHPKTQKSEQGLARVTEKLSIDQ